jgi:hypothetical protein
VFGGVVEEIGCTNVLVLLVVDDGRFKDVEGEEIRNFLGGGVLVLLAIVFSEYGRTCFNDVGPDHLLSRCIFLVQEPMFNFVSSEHRCHLRSFQESLQ